MEKLSKVYKRNAVPRGGEERCHAEQGGEEGPSLIVNAPFQGEHQRSQAEIDLA